MKKMIKAVCIIAIAMSLIPVSAEETGTGDEFQTEVTEGQEELAPEESQLISESDEESAEKIELTEETENDELSGVNQEAENTHQDAEDTGIAEEEGITGDADGNEEVNTPDSESEEMADYSGDAAGEEETELTENTGLYRSSASDFEYHKNDQGTITITGYHGTEHDLDVPSRIDGLKVTALEDETFLENTDLYSVTLPDTVNYIGVGLFEGCSNLEKAVLSDNITIIPRGTFFECNRLREVVVSPEVETVEMLAFYRCYSLTNIDFLPASVSTIEEVVFWECSGLINAKIPEKVTSLAGGLFSDCNNLKTVVLPEGLESIGDGTFLGCNSLTEINIPASVKLIDDNAFTYCYDLEKMVFYGDAPDIGGSAFNSDTFTAYYPKGNTTWTAEKRQNYFGTITWKTWNKPQEISMDSSQAALALGDTAILKPSQISEDYDIRWVSTDSSVVSVEDGNITAAGIGTATIIAVAGSQSESCDIRVQFTDVTNPADFFYSYVYDMADRGVVGGYTDGTFRPYNDCNRAAVVTFLWRLAGKPEPKKTAKFSDMTGNADFDKAISWASEEGITTGWEDNTFRPWNTCNRAAIMTFLWRYAGKPSVKASKAFSDMTGNPDFDKAISWGVKNGITTGWNDGTFRPWNTCNRLAIVSFLSRYNGMN